MTEDKDSQLQSRVKFHWNPPGFRVHYPDSVSDDGSIVQGPLAVIVHEDVYPKHEVLSRIIPVIDREVPPANAAEVMILWIADLRSGKFKQGRGCLRAGNRYCCLGVLCEIAVRDLKETELKMAVVQWPECSYYTYLMAEQRVSCAPPAPLSDFVGISDDDYLNRLINMNDRDRASFSVIATWLEERFLQPRHELEVLKARSLRG